MQDDQKGSQEPDPWAGIDADGDGAPREEFTFSFDEVDAERPDITAVGSGEPGDMDPESPGDFSDAGEAARLSIFPPRAESDTASDSAPQLHAPGDPTAAQSEDFSEDAAAPSGSWEGEVSGGDAGRQDDPADGLDDDFDAQLARELAEDLEQDLAMEPERASSRAAGLDPSLEDPALAGLSEGFGDSAGESGNDPSGGSPFGESDFGEAAAAGPTATGDVGLSGIGIDDAPGESAAGDSGFGSSGFGDLGIAESATEAAESPFAVNGGDGSFAVGGGVVDSVVGVATAAAVTTGAAAAADSGGRQRKKSSGLGQMVGVAAGGLMALPITYAILIWGFQKDPFKLGRQLPPQLAALLPQKLQPGAKSQTGRGSPAVKQPGATGSLDDLAATAVPDDVTVQTEDGQPADTPPADPQADGEMEPGEKPAAADPAAADPEAVADAKPGDEPVGVPADEPGDASPVTSPAATAGDLAALLKEEMKEEPGEPAAPAPADDEPAETQPARPAPGDLAAALPAIGGLPGFEPGPPAVAAVAEPPPLDLARMEDAVERAAMALDAIDEPADDEEHDAARDRRLVSWYKRLARVGEELVRLETEAADSSRPLDETPAAVAGLLERIGGDAVAVADLERLGRMWLTKRAQRAEGAAIVATIAGSRQVGPYWITHTTVVEVDADEPGRKVTIVSRRPPPAEVGDRVIAAGVMFDDDTVWAAEVWPVGGVVGADEMEEEMEDALEKALEKALGTRLEDEPVKGEGRPVRPPVTGLDDPDAPAPAVDAPEPDSAEPGDAEKPEMKKDGEDGGSEPTEPAPEPGTAEQGGRKTGAPKPAESEAGAPRTESPQPAEAGDDEAEPAESDRKTPAATRPAAADDESPVDADPAPPATTGETDAGDADAA